MHLPVIGRGISMDKLPFFMRVLRLTFALFLIGLFLKAGSFSDEISLVFLSMTLLSPLARSHQFIVWLFPLSRWTQKKMPAGIVELSFFFYALQGVPYGKAAGKGTVSNLILWLAYAWQVLRCEKKELEPDKKLQEISFQA